jgi:hypothetical protein
MEVWGLRRRGTNILNLRITPWLLASELVTREPEDGETLVGIFFVELLEAFVLLSPHQHILTSPRCLEITNRCESAPSTPGLV